MPNPAKHGNGHSANGNHHASFESFLARAAATLPDDAHRAAFTQFSDALQQIPAQTRQTLDNGVLLHGDYSRLVAEHRQATADLQRREAELQQRLQAAAAPATAELQILQNELQSLRAKAQGFDTVRARLDAQNLTELVQEDGDVFWNSTQTQPGAIEKGADTTMNNPAIPTTLAPADPATPVQLNGQWYVPAAAPTPQAPAQAQFNAQNPFAPLGQPAASAPYITRDELAQALQESVLPILAQGFSASTQAAQEVAMFCHEWQALKGQQLDPRIVNSEWQQSGKQFDQFLEEKYQLNAARAEKAATDRATDIANAAQQLFDQRWAAMAASGSLHAAPPPTETPLFAAIKVRPDGLRQAPSAQVTHVPGAPSHQAAPQPTQVPPTAAAAANTPVAPVNPASQQPVTPAQPPVMSGAEAAARALASRTHAGDRWDITRPAG